MRKKLFAALVAAVVLTGCESQAEKDRKAKADYATYTANACRHAQDNVRMVENVGSAMNKPSKSDGLRSFAKTVCAEATKAAADAKADR